MALHVRYFERANGDILIPPDEPGLDYCTPCPPDCIEREANTLAEIDQLTARLQSSIRQRLEEDLQRDEQMTEVIRQQVGERLRARIASSATTQYERDFCSEYAKLREEHKEEYRRRFRCREAFFELREFDKPRNAEETLGESLITKESD